MKRQLYMWFLGMSMAVVFAACAGGQIQDASLTEGTDGAGSNEAAVTFTDPGGASIEGGTIEPNKAIFVTFENTVAGIDAALVCDGEIVEIVVVPLSDTQFKLLPTSGRFPQKTTCELSVNALAGSSAIVSASVVKTVYTQSFDVGCDTLDLFENDKTLDLTTASFAYGSGCWKANYLEGGVPRANYDFLGGLLVMDAATNAGEADTTKAPTIYKTIKGDDYEVRLDIADMQYTFVQQEGASDEVRVFVIMGENLAQLIEDAANVKLFMLGYLIRLESGEVVSTYKLVTGTISDGHMSSVEQQLDDASIPSLGFIKEGAVVTPYYSFDEGGSKHFFNIGGASRSFDLNGIVSDASEVDVGVFVGASTLINFADMFFDTFMVIGSDAEFVP